MARLEALVVEELKRIVPGHVKRDEVRLRKLQRTVCGVIAAYLKEEPGGLTVEVPDKALRERVVQYCPFVVKTSITVEERLLDSEAESSCCESETPRGNRRGGLW